jgi:hypothetical protein
MESNLKRRSFFSLIGKSTVGVVLLSAFPIKSIFGIGRKKNTIKVKIHPDAVSRNKKGLAG